VGVKKGELRRQQLLEATMQQIIEEGIGETTVAAVAKRAGISKGIIHYYYPDKRALLKDALRAAEEDFIASAMTDIPPGESPYEQLAALVRNALPLTERGFRMQRIWFNLLATAMVDPELAALQQEYHRRWREHVEATLARLRREDALPNGVDPMSAMRVVVAFCDGLSTLLLTGPAAEREHVDADVRSFVERLLAPGD
jgi:AcrR family transcriptional regulator